MGAHALAGRRVPQEELVTSFSHLRYRDPRLPHEPRDMKVRNGRGIANGIVQVDRKSTRLNSSHLVISYAVFCLKKKNTPSKFVKRPLNVAGVSRHSVRTTSIASITPAPRSACGTPHSSNSFGFSPPTPTPKMRRPPDSTSSVEVILAAIAGGRSASR